MSNERYLFVSYAHKDAAVVLPCIEAMKRSGINVWYDEGIQAGSEWPEYIAEKVDSCTKFILFISPAYLESQNCKRELNFAISRKKDILSVFIDEVTLSLGMEMQLGTYQAIFRRRYSDEASFHTSLCQEGWLNDCRSSFTQPVQNQPPKQPVQSATYTAPAAQNVVNNALATKPYRARKSKITAALLAIFLGGLGIHKFYLNKTLLGIIYIIFCWTYIPGIISFIEGFVILAMNDQAFDKKYNK